ncbi:zinc transport system substrate-binding protein [Lachnotalea glycerini]|jgi:zinc transport system substrate-binding protein|uniref:Zinc ABC transporter substrate-binding protein n=1 Tax=Lachnotalea glycerini TaxID=1763509 RepID=A0A255IB38_9FIRM|nr:metal ABC transporter substrate-binding protein [Lachnotalea glycerini]PXV95783.1 zinc transport system substrate-binding protein [Lachnotalea glycerini]RDY33151.1 zinc ABC transporter substrate-binding protein [Lachnotalea glycerini]
MKRKTLLIIAALLLAALVGCGQKTNQATEDVAETSKELTTSTEENAKLNVVATLFPYYDFVREIAQDKVNLTMLVPAGMDTHSFEPTPADMIEVNNADVFIYNGGEMESWVTKVLSSTENKKQISACMMDYVETVIEEETEGMEPEEAADEEEQSEEEPEYDEHIWTSPVNAQKIVIEICNVLKEADPNNADYYQMNADNYVKELEELDSEFKEVVENSKYKIMIFGDKFPLRYFVDQYGLSYRAAFNGCSSETEPSADTVAYLIDKVKQEQLPAVYHIELSSGKIAETISEATGAKVLEFNSCHNVSQEDFNNKVTYLQLMHQNVEALKEGLNE